MFLRSLCRQSPFIVVENGLLFHSWDGAIAATVADAPKGKKKMSETTEKTEVSLDAAEKVIKFIRASYAYGLALAGVSDEEIDALDAFVDDQLILAQDMVKEKLGL